MNTLKKEVEYLSQNFLVSNINLENAKFIFILESPHIQELKYGLPVSGGSGKMMTKHLFPKQYETSNLPLGRFVDSFKDTDEEVSRVGIMNICRIPMQKSAYPEDVQSKYQRVLNILERLRKNVKRLTSEESFIKESMINNFMKELEKVKENAYIIPCGKTAENYFSQIDIFDKKYNYIAEIPHPSFGSWSKQKYKHKIDELKDIFNK